MTKILSPLSSQIVAHRETCVLDCDVREHIFVAAGEKKDVSIAYEVKGNVAHEVLLEVGQGALCEMSLLYGAHEKNTKIAMRISVLLKPYATLSFDIASLSEVVEGKSDVRIFVVFSEGAKATVRAFTRANGSRSVVHEEIRGLMLADSARASFIPELSLSHEDIVATHATSVMKINEKCVAYLLSRGFLREDATKCLVDAFLGNECHPEGAFSQTEGSFRRDSSVDGGSPSE